MQLTGLHRSRISRDTRLLLMTVCVAVAALWILARLRFPERPVTANPIPPLLTQLVPRATLEDLASEVLQLQPFVVPLLRALDVQSLWSTTDNVLGPPFVPALRIRPDVVVTMLDVTGSAVGAPIAGRRRRRPQREMAPRARADWRA